MAMMPSAVMPWATRIGAGAASAGGGAGVLLRQNPASAVIPSQADSWPIVRANQVASPSMVQPAGIK